MNIEPLKKTILQLAIQGKLTESWRLSEKRFEIRDEREGNCFKASPRGEVSCEARRSGDLTSGKACIDSNRHCEPQKEAWQSTPPLVKCTPNQSQQEALASMSAEALLAKIQAEKAELIKQGKLKKEKPLPPIKEEEIPFDIPETWKWAKLGEIIILTSGQDLQSTQYNNQNIGLPYITGASNIDNEKIIINRWTTEPRAYGYKGDLLLTCKGTVGKTAILLEEKVHIARQIMSIRLISGLNIKYIEAFIKNQINGLKSNAKSMIPGIERSTILNLLIPIPPLAEQQAIVEKVEECFDYLNNIEKAYSSLQRNAVSLKSKILELAIQGKLVEQRPEEGTAEELLKQIQAEKAELIKQGKLKKEKPLPPIKEEEIPFDIPDTWQWAKLKDLCVKIVDGSHNPPTGLKEKTDYIMMSSGNINYDKLVDFDKVRYLPKEVFDIENNRTKASKGDIFLTIVATLGRSCVYDGEYNVCFQRSVAVIKTQIFNKYLKYVFDSPFIQTFIKSNATGTAQKGFYLKQLENLIIPLPPLAEQHRIVAKIEELFAIIDTLANKV